MLHPKSVLVQMYNHHYKKHKLIFILKNIIYTYHVGNGLWVTDTVGVTDVELESETDDDGDAPEVKEPVGEDENDGLTVTVIVAVLVFDIVTDEDETTDEVIDVVGVRDGEAPIGELDGDPEVVGVWDGEGPIGELVGVVDWVPEVVGVREPDGTSGLLVIDDERDGVGVVVGDILGSSWPIIEILPIIRSMDESATTVSSIAPIFVKSQFPVKFDKAIKLKVS